MTVAACMVARLVDIEVEAASALVIMCLAGGKPSAHTIAHH